MASSGGFQDPTRPLTCDLRSAVPAAIALTSPPSCPALQNIATVTAAMLSARFPYITTSGVVTSCDHKNVLAGQFVDGGYVDSSGLLTLADLIPSLTAEVRAHNAAAVAQAAPGKPVTLVVPIVMYLGSRPRPDPVEAAASRIQEPFCPSTHSRPPAPNCRRQTRSCSESRACWAPVSGCHALQLNPNAPQSHPRPRIPFLTRSYSSHPAQSRGSPPHLAGFSPRPAGTPSPRRSTRRSNQAASARTYRHRTSASLVSGGWLISSTSSRAANRADLAL